MTSEDKQFLEDNRIHHETLTKAFYMRQLSGETRSRMQEIIGKYWQPGYITDLWCGSCVSDMVLKLYRHYDEWLIKQKEQEIIDEIGIQPSVIVEVKPEPSEPVKATFPSHKKNHQRK